MRQIIDYINRPFEKDEPKQKIGIGSFTLFARVEESTSLTSSVPTSFLEDGSFAQDHVTNNPVVLDITGEVSDLYIEREAAPEAITRAQAEIGNIASKYAGKKSQAAIQRGNALINSTLDVVRGIDQAIADGKQALSFLGNQDKSSKTNQQDFIDTMEAVHFGRGLVSIKMENKTHDNMRITSFVYSRNNTENKTSFKITASEVRFAETIYTDIEKFLKKPSPALNKQTDSTKDQGVQEPVKDQALLFKIKQSAQIFFGGGN